MKPLEPILTVCMPPHVHCGRTIKGYMGETLVALLPAAVMAVVAFGLGAVRVMALSCAVAVVTEALCNRILQHEQSVDDLSALHTGLLFAFLLPASAPWWLVTIGAASSIFLGKMIYGGLGGNPLCAPLVGWALCRISWPEFMDTNTTMLTLDLPAPLQQLKYFGLDAIRSIDSVSLLSGSQLGGLGAVQVATLLAGGLFLLLRRHIRWEIPTAFIGGLLLTAWIYQLIDPATYASPLFHLLAGGGIFGAFFLATDPASSPIGRIPSLLFGLMAGTMVIIIRVYGIYPDGVPFAILLANLFTPLLDRIRPKPFGGPYTFLQEGQPVMREMLKMILVLSLICGLSGLTLATIRQATSQRIEEQVLTYVQGPALKQIFTDYDNNPVKDRKTFNLPDGPITVFPAMKDGKLTGVAFETFGKGYGGPIGIMVGFTTDGSKLLGIGVTTLKETPGLGARIVEPSFRDQFSEHTTKSIALKKTGGDITPVSGATISSTGTVAAVNSALKIFNQIKDKLPTAWNSQDNDMSKLWKEFSKGLWKDLPPFKLVLGLCPVLAVTKTAYNGLGMGIAVIFVLALSNLLVSMLRNLIPAKVRIACFIVVAASLVVCVELLMQAYAYPLYLQLGIFVPLIVVNCIILGRAEAFASKNPTYLAVADGLGMGLGYTLSLTFLGSIRELLGYGTWFGMSVMGDWFQPFTFMIEAPGAFVCLGLLLAGINVLTNWQRKSKGLDPIEGPGHSCKSCGMCASKPGA